ncbi:Rv3654c family TadE-like protein [Streptomyces sp. NPDC013313]|uniref:Rv3654c family TadE-like protein n=1 Tax=Streptomyces sp. NPDC013313 TaxID=3155603 RepID=UPI00340B8AF4
MRRRLQGLRHGPRCSDRGSATVWSVGVITVLCVVFGVVLALGQAVVVRHRAAGGADLAALAAADHWAEGTAGACARAERVAAAQGVRLVRCVIVGETSDVTAASGRGPFAAEVRSRAGPPGPLPPAAGPATGPGHLADHRRLHQEHRRLHQEHGLSPAAPAPPAASPRRPPEPPAAAP